jgi:hypothetical protein
MQGIQPASVGESGFRQNNIVFYALKQSARLQQILRVIQNQREGMQHLREVAGIFRMPGKEQDPGSHICALLMFVNLS